MPHGYIIYKNKRNKNESHKQNSIIFKVVQKLNQNRTLWALDLPSFELRTHNIFENNEFSGIAHHAELIRNLNACDHNLLIEKLISELKSANFLLQFIHQHC